MLMMSANKPQQDNLNPNIQHLTHSSASPDGSSQKVKLPSINKLFPSVDAPPAKTVFPNQQQYIPTTTIVPHPFAAGQFSPSPVRTISPPVVPDMGQPPVQPVVFGPAPVYPVPPVQPVQSFVPVSIPMQLSESVDSAIGTSGARRSASQESRFKCDKCHKSYTRKHNLISHKLSVHEKEKLFSCTECQVKFSRSSDLSRHTKEQHSSNVKPFICGGINPDGTSWGCGKQFYRKDQLKSHLSTNKAEFKCLKKNFPIMMPLPPSSGEERPPMYG
ncbi:hypothetical protein OGAPHI_001275 [Ogataea philodendri]|uniref:C2H2-type domain-containing protein n=1 Tax=Ogataea philodendri TaxID=1378263 RepID=A0A9P8T9M7_9ASCO|nr:uncharacterized protein OGAPHI_001275 [Ogataea philodendri]KAH3670759.1 hypothetical protein OGAPHI_001275 [Ogataea philodendri]